MQNISKKKREKGTTKKATIQEKIDHSIDRKKERDRKDGMANKKHTV